IFLFSFFVEAGLLNCINRNPVPRGTTNHPHEGALNSGLTSARLGAPVGSRDRVKVSAKIQQFLHLLAEKRTKLRAVAPQEDFHNDRLSMLAPSSLSCPSENRIPIREKQRFGVMSAS